jgi:hypothetical protein
MPWLSGLKNAMLSDDFLVSTVKLTILFGFLYWHKD